MDSCARINIPRSYFSKNLYPEMDRVLKRVGLTKRTQLDNETHLTTDENVKIRRRRRSKSRRRYQSNSEINKKSRGLFNIDWDVVKDCKSCKSKAITRRFCSKKVDNELYRSNSFKFERFIRNGDDLSPIKRKSLFGSSERLSKELISLCEDYSLPADHLAELAKRRPNSIAVTNNCFLSQNFSDLILSSPEVEHVVVLDIYSTPRDSHQKLEEKSHRKNQAEEKYFTSPDKEYSQPYTTDESSNPSVDEEDFAYHPEEKANPPNLNSPDSVNEFPVEPPTSFLDALSPTKTELSITKRHPSPYYYGDLFKYKTEQHIQSSPKKATYASVKKNQSLKEGSHRVGESYKRTKSFRKHKKPEGHKHNEEKHRSLRSRESFKLQKKSSSADSRSNSSRDGPNEKFEENQDSKFLNTLYCLEDGLGDMTRQRHVYETAFDCSINKSDDDLDQIERVTNHPVLVQWNNDKSGSESSTKGKIPTLLKATKSKTQEDNKPSHSKEDNKSIINLSQTFQKIRLGSEAATSSSLGGSSMCGYTPSPPSTAPLPSKFPGKELMMNSIRSAPNLPSKTHTKDLNLPNKSLKSRTSASSSGSLQIRHGSAFDIEFGSSSNINPLISEFKGRPGNSREQTGEMERFSEIKSRPKPNLLMVPKDSVIRRIRHKYSSTESMTTSSSGGSMESIKSSTSEGNRSTSSSSSRQSASLSSHSSDSGSNRPKYYAPPQNFLGQQASNKLHILSPISDKSSQEPISETSDNNKNNNSQKCSPDTQNEATTSIEVKTTKKRFPQNKNLLSLNFHQDRPEIQGSDSGISIQSREGINKSRYALGAADLLGQTSHHDFSDLPFDMPKLRRRRIILDTACTSGSATSIDFKELPFDMPKLRRKLRLQTGNLEDSASQASSSQSVLEANRGHIRPKLTLNLGEAEGGRKGSGLGLTLSGIGTNEGASTSAQSSNLNFSLCENIDTGIPLEKQGWFHGSITRIEAENVLRALREGSFLVRNSESIKNDYSLSLKSARGFMHMRIQRSNDNGCFILGQFSKPFTSIPEMIKHFSMNRLPIRGAEHMCLLQPVIAQLL